MPPPVAPPAASDKPRPRPPAAPLPRPARERAALATAAVAGVFCALVVLTMLVEHVRALRANPLNSLALAQLKAALAQDPGNEQLKQRARVLDLELRRAHDHHLALDERGAWLLLGGMTVFLLATQTTLWRRRLIPPRKTPKPPGHDARKRTQATAAVVVVGGVVCTAAWVLSQRSSSALPRETAKPAGATAAPPSSPPIPATPFPTAAEVQRNWPEFRGPDGLGVSAYTNVPMTWNVQTGENVLWKAALPAADFNSPVVWDNRVFLTTGDARKREVLCFDALSGQLVWQKAVENVPGSNTTPLDLPQASSGYAAATVATDGRRVYAFFANGDLAALTYDGQIAWSRSLGKLDNAYAHASPPRCYHDRLLLQLDQGDGQDGKSKLLALDPLSGKTVWESAARPAPRSWATPVVIHTGAGDQIITDSNPWVIAYEAANGAELWRAKVLAGEVTPSPIFAGGLVLAVNDGAQLSALRPAGHGDVTQSGLAWSADQGLPEICSPLADGQRVYLLNTYGQVTCFDLPTGKQLWDKDLENEFKASPSLVGDHVYLVSVKGTTIVLQAGPAFKELARSELGEEVIASPAFTDARLYLRGKDHLFCLGAKPRP